MDLVDEHQNNCSVTPSVPGEEGEGIGMGEELVTESPVHSNGRWKSKCVYIEGGQKIYVLEFLRLPHCMHDFPVNINRILEIQPHPITTPAMNYQLSFISILYILFFSKKIPFFI